MTAALSHDEADQACERERSQPMGGMASWRGLGVAWSASFRPAVERRRMREYCGMRNIERVVVRRSGLVWRKFGS